MKIDNWTFEFFRKKLETIERMLVDIKKQGEKIMSQQDDLIQETNDEDVALTTLLASVKKVDTDIETLMAKVGTLTPADISAQLTLIKAHTAAIVDANQQLADEDAKFNPPTPPSAS